MKKNNSVSLWVNSWQNSVLASPAKKKMSICGRGTGKTTLFGIKNRQRLKYLPRARGLMAAKTYKQILNNSLPPMEKMWNSIGLVEYDFKEKSGHYVIGQKPPSHFDKPFAPPKQFDHVITFYNGLTIDMFSMDRPSSNRGGSFDFIDVDEITLMKRDAIEKNMVPMLRGGKDIYGEDNPLHGTLDMYGSQPWLAEGLWVYDYEEKAKEMPADFFYSEANARCNLAVLGKNWMEEQRSILTPDVYDIEIENLRRIICESPFYHEFSESKHVYEPKISYKTDPTGRGIMFDQMDDYNPDQLLDTAWDFSGWFTGALIFQQQHSARNAARITEKMINSFSVQKGKAATQVVRAICEHYKSHKLKYVRIWGEPRGKDMTAFGQTLFESIAAEFRAQGWQCELKVTVGQAHSHDLRYKWMNDMLQGKHGFPALQCNQDTCKAPIIAIQSTNRDPNGKKDKRKERDPKFNQEHAPHFTDALDYYFMQKHYKSNVGMGMTAWTA